MCANTCELAYFRLPHPLLLAISGKDSARYLNARLTNDIKLLEINSHLTAAALSPHGKTEGLFQVVRLASDSFVLLCDGGEMKQVQDALLRYKVADRVDVQDLVPVKQVIHVFGKGLDTFLKDYFGSAVDKEGKCLVTDTGLFWKSARTGQPGADIISDSSSFESLTSELQTRSAIMCSEDERQKLRIAAGIPAFPEEINSQTLFYEAGFKDAISFKKGCYVGQEVVEKIDSHGKVSRCLAHITVDGQHEIPLGEKIFSTIAADGEPIGAASSQAAFVEGKTYFFARVQSDLNTDSVTIAGAPGTIRLYR